MRLLGLLLFGTSWGLRDVAVQSLETQCADAPPSDLDLRSVQIRGPDFSFLNSREFFLAKTSSCDEPVRGLKLHKVKKSIQDRRAQLSQRFRVKQLKASLQAAAQNRLSGRTVKEAVLGVPGEEESAAAVELHMFPEDWRNITSTWRALLVPTVKEAFDKDWFLCRPAGELVSPCVAKLAFQQLPQRVSSLAGSWYEHLDRHQSSPEWLLLVMELILLLGLAWLLLLTVYTVHLLIRAKPDLRACEVQEWDLPCRCCLSQHAFVYRGPQGETAREHEPFDAGSFVEVKEVCEIPATFAWALRCLDVAEVYNASVGKPKSQVWGRLADPAGWLLLDQEGDAFPKVVKADEETRAVWKPHRELVPSAFVLMRRILVLVAAHTSAQWVLVEYFTKSFSFQTVMVLVFSVLAIHATVLYQQDVTLTLGLQYEEALKSHQLLRLPSNNLKCLFALVLPLAFVCAPIVCKLLARRFERLASDVGFLASLAVHGKILYDILVARKKWRTPELATEEIFPSTMKALPTTDEAPCLARGKKWLLLRYATTSLCVLAAMLAARITLDILQLRGELVDYGVNRGKLMYPSGSFAYHNTLLLGSQTDSLTLSLELGDFTVAVEISVAHPLLPDREVQLLNRSGELQVSLPPGPLYSRLSLLAVGDYANTTYTIHVLRSTEAMNVSLTSSFDATKYPELKGSTFTEQRRLEYQRNHRTWHAPDIDFSSASLRVAMTAMVLAPLTNLGGHKMASVAATCNCGMETPGEGSQCAFEQKFELGNESFCVFQPRVEQRLRPDLREGGVAGQTSGILEWLQDTNFSGKSVRLVSPLGEAAFSTSVKKKHSLTITFHLSNGLQALSEDAILAIGTTPDLMSSEALDVPIVVVPHAPVPKLALNCYGESSVGCFVLPALDFTDVRGNYAVCGGQSSLDNIIADVSDDRFELITSNLQQPSKCHGEIPDKRREFRSVRRLDSGCGNWCAHYLPREETYDIAVDASTFECFKLAMSFEDVNALRYAGLMTGGDKCKDEGWLGEAIRRNFSVGVEEMLDEGADPNNELRGATPLSIAAANGNLEAMKLLIDKKASVQQVSQQGTALSLAAGQCQLDAVRFLLDRGATVTPESEWNCKQSALVQAIVKHAKGTESCQGHAGSMGEAPHSFFSDVLAMLHEHTPTETPDCRGMGLIEAFKNADLVAVAALLDGVKNVTSLAGDPSMDLVELWSAGTLRAITDSFFLAAMELLVKRGLDIKNNPAAIPTAAMECKVEVVKKLLDLGADPSSKMEGMEASELVSECTADEQQGIKDALATHTT